MARKTLTISLPPEELETIEMYWRVKGYKDRSTFIKDTVMDKIRTTKGFKKRRKVTV